ncbi:MAG: hypothetical protein J6K72_10180 [Clostridia bacterium]|nr:hypothetical protein [Clostridia bacterium]
MDNRPQSKYLDEKINIIKSRLSNEQNSIDWSIEQQRTNLYSEKLVVGGDRPSSNKKLKYINHTIVSSYIAWPISVVGGFVLGALTKSVLVAVVILPCLFLFLWHMYDRVAVKRQNEIIQSKIDGLDDELVARYSEAQSKANKDIQMLIAEYKEKVKAYGKHYHSNPISMAVAKWLASIMIPKINNANRADFYPHIKVPLTYTVTKECVTTEGNQTYSLRDVGFVFDTCDYAPMGFSYAVSMHLKKLIKSKFPKDPSGTPCNVTSSNNDATATCTYDAINGNFH